MATRGLLLGTLFGEEAVSTQVEFIGASQASFPADQATEDGDTVVIPVPPATQAGDIMLVMVRWASASPVTPPGGWTQIANPGTGKFVYSRTAGGSEPASYTWNGATDTGRSACIAVFRNASVGDVAATTLPSSNPMTAPSVDSSSSGAALVVLSGKALVSFASSFTATSPLIEAVQHEAAQGDGGNPNGSFIAYELEIGIGTISGREFTHGQTFDANATSVILEKI